MRTFKLRRSSFSVGGNCNIWQALDAGINVVMVLRACSGPHERLETMLERFGGSREHTAEGMGGSNGSRCKNCKKFDNVWWCFTTWNIRQMEKN